WSAVTDYEHFPEIFPTVSAAHAEPAGDRRHHLTGTVTSVVGSWPIDVVVHHEETPPKYRARWAGAGGSGTCNRGRWGGTAAGPVRALLAYTLEVEVAHSPAFLVRNVLLSRQPAIIAAVEARLRQPAPPP